MTREEQQRRKREQQREQRRRHHEQREIAKGPIDLPFLLLVMILLSVGLIMLMSASFPSAQVQGNAFSYIIKQVQWAAIGLVGMFIVGKIDYQRFRGVATIALLISVVLLALVLVPGIGITRNNATRWLGIPNTEMTFQPTEIAKFGVIVYFAASISKKREKMRTFQEGILPYGVILVLVAGLVLLEPHMSGAILLLGIGAVMMAVGGIHWGWLALGGGGGAVGGYLLLYTDLMEKIGYNSHRITTWRDPFWDMQDKSYQMAQSFITIGSGGLWGVGLGKSRQKFMFLPEEHNDFIFAVICEELGLIGATLIMFLFALLIMRGYWLAIHARDRFGSLLIVGVITQIALQTFLNIAVVSGVIPATGISLPFFSYGGTALVFQLAEIGIVLSVSRQIPAPKNN